MAKLVASDGASGDEFGWSVSIYNNIIAVGALYDDTTNGGLDAGDIYICVCMCEREKERELIMSYKYIMCIMFITYIHVYTFLFITISYFISGSAYVFSYNSINSQWTQVAKLVASDGASGDAFGQSVSIYNNIITMGAYRVDTTNGGTDAGIITSININNT